MGAFYPVIATCCYLFVLYILRRCALFLTTPHCFLLFLLQVTLSGVTWYVAHRYTEFAVLRSFLMHQNPYIQEFKEVDEKFPGKAFGLSFRRSVLERRIEGLGAFLVFFLRNARLCRQTSIDAVCSFLTVRSNLRFCPAILNLLLNSLLQTTILFVLPAQIPENLSTLPKPAGPRTPPPVRDAATAASLTNAAAAAAGASRVSSFAIPRGVSTAIGAGAVGDPEEEEDNSPEHNLWKILGKKGMAVIKHGTSEGHLITTSNYEVPRNNRLLLFIISSF